MDRFTSENYEGFACTDDREEDNDGEDTSWAEVRLRRLAATPAAECANCFSTRKSVQSDREIRAGAVCCDQKAVA